MEIAPEDVEVVKLLHPLVFQDRNIVELHWYFGHIPVLIAVNHEQKVEDGFVYMALDGWWTDRTGNKLLTPEEFFYRDFVKGLDHSETKAQLIDGLRKCLAPDDMLRVRAFLNLQQL